MGVRQTLNCVLRGLAGLSLSAWAIILIVVVALVVKSTGHTRADGPTVAVAAAAIIGLVVAWSQLRINNSIRTTELITTIYSAFVDDRELFDFYTKVRTGGEVGKDDERLLNKSLTLFDKANYLRTQGLLHETDWEYIASEIQFFALNEFVWDYVVKRMQEGRGSGLPWDIIPFTGFPDLLDNVPKCFRGSRYPGIPDRHKTFLGQIPTQSARAKLFQWLCRFGRT